MSFNDSPNWYARVYNGWMNPRPSLKNGEWALVPSLKSLATWPLGTHYSATPTSWRLLIPFHNQVWPLSYGLWGTVVGDWSAAHGAPTTTRNSGCLPTRVWQLGWRWGLSFSSLCKGSILTQWWDVAEAHKRELFYDIYGRYLPQSMCPAIMVRAQCLPFPLLLRFLLCNYSF